jgi:glycosyltransferase involved in cell wall biosynthesis
MLLLSSLLLLWTLLGYPLLMLGLAARRRHSGGKPPAPPRRPPPGDRPPRIGVVVPACNEAGQIGARIDDLLAQEVPPRWIVVVSDGSRDATHAIAAAHADERVIALPPLQRRGKLLALQRGVEALRPHLSADDLLLFTDANARFEPRTLRRLRERFTEPTLGSLSGIRAGQPESLLGRLFRRYESALLVAESRTGSALAAAGELLALRAGLALRLLPTLSPTITNDDFAIAMAVVAAGRRHRVDPALLAWEPATGRQRPEFMRRLRISAGRARDLCREGWPPGLWVRFQLLSHKGLRLLLPWLLLAPVVHLLQLSATAGTLARDALLLLLALALLGQLLPAADAAGRARNHLPPPCRRPRASAATCSLLCSPPPSEPCWASAASSFGRAHRAETYPHTPQGDRHAANDAAGVLQATEVKRRGRAPPPRSP